MINVLVLGTGPGEADAVAAHPDAVVVVRDEETARDLIARLKERGIECMLTPILGGVAFVGRVE